MHKFFVMNSQRFPPYKSLTFFEYINVNGKAFLHL